MNTKCILNGKKKNFILLFIFAIFHHFYLAFGVIFLHGLLHLLSGTLGVVFGGTHCTSSIAAFLGDGGRGR